MHEVLTKALTEYQRLKMRPEEVRIRKIYRALARVHPFLSLQKTDYKGEVFDQVMVRVTTRCNQDCPFCHAIPPQPGTEPSLEAVQRALVRVTRIFPGAKVVLTGGEPTLRKDLQELVGYLVDLENVRVVVVQTNGVIIGSYPERFSLSASDKLRFLVSMHGAEPSIYDACTATRGQLPLARKGIRHLVSLDHRVELNCVVNARNIDHLEDVVSSVPRLFSGGRLPELHFSIMAISEHRKAPDFLVRHPHMLAKVNAALAHADRVGVVAAAAFSASHASIPPCLLPEEMVDLSEYPRMYEHEGLSADNPSLWWEKSGSCDACDIADCCLGLSRAYAQRFGFDELRPFPKPGDA